MVSKVLHVQWVRRERESIWLVLRILKKTEAEEGDSSSS